MPPGWTTIFSSGATQIAEGAMPHLCMQERKYPAPVRRRLSWIHAVLDRAILGVWAPFVEKYVGHSFKLLGMNYQKIFRPC